MIRSMDNLASRYPGVSYPVPQISAFLEAYFPKRELDVPFLYHAPMKRINHSRLEADAKIVEHVPIDLSTHRVHRIILSVTPTKGVYKTLNNCGNLPPMVFLHRPFALDRRRVRKGSTVLSSHVGFDEALTVGYNTVLASRLGGGAATLELSNVIEESLEQYLTEKESGPPAVAQTSPSYLCLKGYKDDINRRIGIVERITDISASQVLAKIKHEFGDVEAVFGFGDEDNYSPIMQQGRREDTSSLREFLTSLGRTASGDEHVSCLAIMNAFREEEIDRVIAAAKKYDYLQGDDAGSRIVFLTGAPRIAGLTYALQKNIKVVCVGHRACEEWGIRYLASELRREFRELQVEEIYEGEESSPRLSRPKRQNQINKPKDEVVHGPISQKA